VNHYYCQHFEWSQNYFYREKAFAFKMFCWLVFHCWLEKQCYSDWDQPN